jgi:hypothetical protein
MDVHSHQGLGKRTEVRTTTDILLVVEAARLAINQEVVQPRSANSERVCVKDLQRCWRVVNDWMHTAQAKQPSTNELNY